MPQRFYIDESDLNGQLTKLDENLFGMLDFAYLHEDMVNTIEELMSEWGKVNIATFNSRVQEFNDLPEDQKNGMKILMNGFQKTGDGGYQNLTILMIKIKRCFFKDIG